MLQQKNKSEICESHSIYSHSKYYIHIVTINANGHNYTDFKIDFLSIINRKV